MRVLRLKLWFVISCIFIFTGCSQNNVNTNGANLSNKTTTKNEASVLLPNKAIKNDETSQLHPNEVKLNNEELTKINVFFSNFSEVMLESFEKDNITNDILIDFAVRHNVLNNYNLIEKYDNLHGKLSSKVVEKSILKYFGKTFSNHKSTQEYKYENGYYIIAYADGEIPSFSSITKLLDTGNNYFTAYVDVYSPQEIDGYPENQYDLPTKWKMSEGTPRPQLTQKVKATIRKESDGSYTLIDYIVNDIR